MREGYCHCGMAAEDPLHYGFHRIYEWNKAVMQDARTKGQEEFEKRLPKKKEIKWTSLDI